MPGHRSPAQGVSGAAEVEEELGVGGAGEGGLLQGRGGRLRPSEFDRPKGG